MLEMRENDVALRKLPGGTGTAQLRTLEGILKKGVPGGQYRETDVSSSMKEVLTGNSKLRLTLYRGLLSQVEISKAGVTNRLCRLEPRASSKLW